MKKLTTIALKPRPSGAGALERNRFERESYDKFIGRLFGMEARGEARRESSGKLPNGWCPRARRRSSTGP